MLSITQKKLVYDLVYLLDFQKPVTSQAHLYMHVFVERKSTLNIRLLEVCCNGYHI